MPRMYAAGVSSTTGAAAAPIATLVVPSGIRARIREIGVFATTAVAGSVGIGRPAAVGVGSPTGVLGQAYDQAETEAAGSTLATSFATTAPTAPTNPLKRIQLPGVIGAGMVWSFDREPILVSASGNFVLWQFSSSAVTYAAYFDWEE